MQPVTIALVQQELAWHDHAANRRMLGAAISGIGAAVDLIVLPEMFSTGFTMAPEAVYETMTGDTVAWMQMQAAATGAVLCGSLALRAEDGRFVNRCMWVRPDGAVTHYDKRHLFRMSGEHEHYAAGAGRVIVELRGWRVCLQICYDLRFPVWSRNRGDYDALLYVANWPAARQHAWSTLLQARAIENLADVIAVNRVGTDANGFAYAGGSCVVSPQGDTLLQAGAFACTPTTTLDGNLLETCRSTFPAWRDADDFAIEQRRPDNGSMPL